MTQFFSASPNRQHRIPNVQRKKITTLIRNGWSQKRIDLQYTTQSPSLNDLHLNQYHCVHSKIITIPYRHILIKVISLYKARPYIGEDINISTNFVEMRVTIVIRIRYLQVAKITVAHVIIEESSKIMLPMAPNPQVGTGSKQLSVVTTQKHEKITIPTQCWRLNTDRCVRYYYV